ncbi:hypothetical protein NQ318_013169 [Aromia moschata]|uniref:Mos1 transposase HTH domain-containing protein n=1 Tax=Aromia moschata TaxID=1265417 RepID=A0AAV8Y4V3_9CUCU|nr:hypothetical protein NQ318_013169 [Aromia moschata]
MLSVQMEQRVNLNFLVKLGKTFTEAYAMLKEVYGNGFLYRTQVFEWFKWFKEGRETTEDRRKTKNRRKHEKIDYYHGPVDGLELLDFLLEQATNSTSCRHQQQPAPYSDLV